ncbi:helix-turn-helix domain-containing protein, partial [Streptomyces sp. NPDC056305]|uniref:helix-turn-helix domain-containing protein n=1 Tax=unclassified Streptomyces TaxID=2593676 RepID=UPI0035E209B2
MSNAAVGRLVDVQAKTVGKWRRKFAAEGLAGLQDAGRIGRPKADLVLSDGERDQLVRWARRAKTAQYLALRAKIVLRCAEGGTNRQAAMDLGIDESTVERWRARFVERRLDGLQDEPRPGRPPRSFSTRSRTCWWRRWSPRRAGTRTGHGPRWPRARGCRSRPSGGSGRSSTSSPISRTPSSSPPT